MPSWSVATSAIVALANRDRVTQDFMRHYRRGPVGETTIRVTMKTTTLSDALRASEHITKRIEELGDWRGQRLARVRQLIHDADPDIQEEWKWMGTPVWSHDGIVCTGESYKQVVKLTFARGACIEDPKQLFNASLDGNTRRAIDLREGVQIDEVAFRHLIRAAVAANTEALARRASRSRPARHAKT